MKKLQEEKQDTEHGQLIFLENKRKIELYDDELEQLTKFENMQKRWQQATTALQSSKGYYENSVSRLNDSRALVEQLEQKWLHGQATILAGKLHDGEACPVCGSSQHPAPALALNDSVPSDEDIKAAKLQASSLEAEKGKAESAYYERQSAQNSIGQSINELLQAILTKRQDFTNEQLEPVKGKIIAKRVELLNEQTNLSVKINKLDSLGSQMETYEKVR